MGTGFIILGKVPKRRPWKREILEKSVRGVNQWFGSSCTGSIVIVSARFVLMAVFDL